MATVYTSKIDAWLVAVLAFAMAVSIYASAKTVLAGASGAWWSVLLTAGLGIVLPLWLLLGTNYTLEPTQLLVKSGPFKWRVPVADITGITPTSNPLASPALSLDRLRIDYGRSSFIIISPRDKDQFIREIESLRGSAG